jgi:hypothetical protein
VKLNAEGGIAESPKENFCRIFLEIGWTYRWYRGKTHVNNEIERAPTNGLPRGRNWFIAFAALRNCVRPTRNKASYGTGSAVVNVLFGPSLIGKKDKSHLLFARGDKCFSSAAVTGSDWKPAFFRSRWSDSFTGNGLTNDR